MSEETDDRLELGLTPRFMWLWASEFVANPKPMKKLSEYDQTCVMAVLREALEARQLLTHYNRVTNAMTSELELLQAGTLIEMNDDTTSARLDRLRRSGQILHMRMLATVERWKRRGKPREVTAEEEKVEDE